MWLLNVLVYNLDVWKGYICWGLLMIQRNTATIIVDISSWTSRGPRVGNPFHWHADLPAYDEMFVCRCAKAADKSHPFVQAGILRNRAVYPVPGHETIRYWALLAKSSSLTSLLNLDYPIQAAGARAKRRQMIEEKKKKAKGKCFVFK